MAGLVPAIHGFLLFRGISLSACPRPDEERAFELVTGAN
jgi:hypothetical protein